MSEGTKLRVVDGGRKSGPRAGKRRALDQSEQITCPKCEATRGVPTSRFRKAIIAPRRRPDGRILGGTEALVCDHCDTQL